MTAHAISPEVDHGTWMPRTKWRAEMEAEDERTSEELARRLGLRSYVQAHPNGARPSSLPRLVLAPKQRAQTCGNCGGPMPDGQRRSSTCSRRCSKAKCRKEARSVGRWGSERRPDEALTVFELRCRRAMLLRILKDRPEDGGIKHRLYRCEAEFQRRAG